MSQCTKNDDLLSGKQAWIASAADYNGNEPDSELPFMISMFKQTTASHFTRWNPGLDAANLSNGSIRFGGDARARLFKLGKDVVYLNHGSYGACLWPCVERQRCLQELQEENGIRFMEFVPHALKRVTKRIANFVNGKNGKIALLRNATMASNEILRSLSVRLALCPQDEIMVFSFGYGAVKNTVHFVAESAGSKVCQIRCPIPIPDDDTLVGMFEEHIKKTTTKIAVFDHVVSGTADILPVNRLVDACRRHGVVSVVDGAHGIGLLPLDLDDDLKPDFYFSNCHKWLMAPKGTAFLYVRDGAGAVVSDASAAVHPTVISHGYRFSFDSEHLWTATDDYTGMIALETALDVFDAFGPQLIMQHNTTLARSAGEMLVAAWETGLLSQTPDSRYAAMVVVRLPDYVKNWYMESYLPQHTLEQFTAPQAAETFRIDYLRSKHHIEIPVLCYEVSGPWYVRLAAQIYLELSDFEKLRDVILDIKTLRKEA
eukprot:ANDGO_07524.mRNA.1 Putative L-cysteine desulfhydrase 1